MENGIKLLMDRQKPNGDWEKVMMVDFNVIDLYTCLLKNKSVFSVIGYLHGTALHLLLNAVLWRRVNSGSMGHGSVGQMGQFFG